MADYYSLFLRPRSSDVDLKEDLERIYGVPFAVRGQELLAAAGETFVEASLSHDFNDDEGDEPLFATHPWEVMLRPRPGEGEHEEEIAMALFRDLDRSGRYDVFLTYGVTDFILGNT